MIALVKRPRQPKGEELMKEEEPSRHFATWALGVSPTHVVCG